MIPSVLSYTKRSIEESISTLFARPEYLRTSILSDIDPEVRDDFIEKYCGSTSAGKKQAHKLNIIIGYPQDIEQLDGSIVVTQGESVENLPSIGGVEGDYKSFTGRTHTEACEVTILDNRDIQLTTTYPVHSIDGIRELSLQDKFIEINERIVTLKVGSVFSREMFTNGDTIHLTYEEKLPKELYGLEIGYSALEQINVSLFSLNYATMICLGAIMKAVVVLMRQTLEGQLLYAVNNVQVSPISPVQDEVLPSTNPNILFTQDYVMQCEVSYAIDKNSTSNIEEIYIIKHQQGLL